VTALGAEAAVLRAVAGPNVGDRADLDGLAAEGAADAVGPGHQPGKVVVLETDQPAAVLSAGLAAVQHAPGDLVDALIVGLIHRVPSP
jgi:hypothetical protein